MASQSLYRKWRSQTFGEFVGQEQIIRTLKNALSSGNLAHAYLFTGPRGTGKTTTARLLAKTINCSQSKNGEPCNVCEQCREITAGNSFNVVEIDAASNRGIDSIRELREKVMMPPTIGKYKVYILDEAHMLTVEAFNALLKTLEEPPPHAIFVLATTDVHKMLPTVLSRCQRFDFKRFTIQQIVGHLRFVATQENITLEPGTAELIARAAAGGMRDALSLLDQAAAYAGNIIALSQVQAMLGVADPQAIQKFISAIAELDSSASLHLIHNLSEAGADLRQINGQVAEYWRAMMLARAGANISEILDYTDDEVREITRMSQLFVLEELTECAKIFAQNELVQRNQGTPQLGLELALLSCLDLHRRQTGDRAVGVNSSSRMPATSSAASHTGHDSHPRLSVAATPAARSNTPVKQEPVHASGKPVMLPSTEVSVSSSTIQAPTSDAPDLDIPAQPQSVQPMAIVDSSEAEIEKNTDDLPDWDSVSYTDDEEELDEDPFVQPAHPVQSIPFTATIVPVTPLLTSSDESNAYLQDVQTPTASEEEEVVNSPSLPLQEVKEKWEYIKRRVKSKKDGAMIAALLNGYTVVGIEESATDAAGVAIPTVVIRANAAFHFSALQKPEHQESIEWALKLELKQDCKVRMLPPGQGGIGSGIAIPPPPPAINSMASRAALAPQASSPYQSAHRERLTSVPVNVPESGEPTPLRPGQQKRQATPPIPSPQEESRTRSNQGGAVSSATVAHNVSPSPLARKADVRENTNTVPTDIGESRLMFAQKKAKNDQVVQEAIRLFKAEVKDIQLK